jgi:hypothetical protein
VGVVCGLEGFGLFEGFGEGEFGVDELTFELSDKVDLCVALLSDLERNELCL